MNKKLFISAANVHQGGGHALLSALLRAVPPGVDALAILDTRFDIPKESTSARLKRVPPTIIGRLAAEWWLKENVKQGDFVLCFGNLPPLFRLRGHTAVFLQNRYLITNEDLTGFSFKIRSRIVLERLWFSMKVGHADRIIVQTPSMKALFEDKFRGNMSLSIMPFVVCPNGEGRHELTDCAVPNDRSCDFLYVSSGEPHKNHKKLIEAWSLLAKEGLFPSLFLTINEEMFPQLSLWLREMKNKFGLRIENTGMLPHSQILELYGRAKAVIFPSTFESFGLPLVEARQAGVPVLASELDFVRDILDPVQTFDPCSAVSIVRAVKRFIGIKEQALPLISASALIKDILGETK